VDFHEWEADAPMEDANVPQRETLWGCSIGGLTEGTKALGVVGIGRVWSTHDEDTNDEEGPNLLVRCSSYIAWWELVGMLEEALRWAKHARDADEFNYIEDEEED
jgi:hypothetical protein